jgi:hypothetical protein
LEEENVGKSNISTTYLPSSMSTVNGMETHITISMSTEGIAEINNNSVPQFRHENSSLVSDSTTVSETKAFLLMNEGSSILPNRMPDYSNNSAIAKEADNNRTLINIIFENNTSIRPSTDIVLGTFISEQMGVSLSNQTTKNRDSITHPPFVIENLNYTMENLNGSIFPLTESPPISSPQYNDKSKLNNSSIGENSFNISDNTGTLSTDNVMENTNNNQHGTSKREINSGVANIGFSSVVETKADYSLEKTTVPVLEVSSEQKSLNSNFNSDETLYDFNIFSHFLDMLKP